MTLDGVLSVLLCVSFGLALGVGATFYHYRDVLAGQARCIAALEDYIDERSEPEDATAEGLGYDD